MHPPIVKLTPDSAPEQPTLDRDTGCYTYPTSGYKPGVEVLVRGHNGALHLAKIIGANTDGTLTLIIYAHQEFDGQPNESLMAQHFRNNVPASELITID